MPPVRVSASYALWLADFLEAEYGVPAVDLFRAAELSAAGLERADGLLSESAHRRLLTVALEQSGDPGLGLRLGLARHFTTLGRLGDALVCSENLRQAIALGMRLQRYTGRFSGRALLLDFVERDGSIQRGSIVEDPLRTSGIAGACGVESSQTGCERPPAVFQQGPVLAAFQLTAAIDLGDLHLLAIEEVLGNLLVHSERVLGAPLPLHHLQLAYPRPGHAASYAVFGCPVEFSAASTRLWFDAAVLDRPLPQASTNAARRYAAECERTLATDDSDDLLSRTRALIAARPAHPPTLEAMAQQLAVSPRTLRRRLQLQGWSFQKIVDSERSALARCYLLESDLDIAAVAERLGYSDVSSFNRAFRKWQGMPPARYRREA